MNFIKSAFKTKTLNLIYIIDLVSSKIMNSSLKALIILTPQKKI